jgi:hypothetical protein
MSWFSFSFFTSDLLQNKKSLPSVTLLTYICELRGSNLGRDTEYPDVFRNFPQILQENTGITR